MPKYQATSYIRLSYTDDRSSESDSVTNQRKLIENFIERNPDIEIISEKIDDGYSGIIFDRPAFKEMMQDIREVMKLNNYDPMALYQYGLYVNSVAGEMKGLDKKKITEAYNSLAIHRRRDLAITSEEIMEALHKEPGEYLSDIYDDIEKEVLYHRLPNEKDSLLTYIKKNFASNS